MFFSVIITFSIFLCVISLWIRWRKHKMSLFQRHGIPGPPPNLLFGNLIEFNKDRNKYIQEWLQQYGKMFGFYLGAKPFLVCADAEFLKICQIRDIHNFTNKEWVVSDAGFPHNSAYNMLEVQVDGKWRNMRNILRTCFTIRKIKMMSTLMSRPIKIFLQNIEKQGEQPFDIENLFQAVIFDIIATSAFGVTTNVQSNENNIFVKSINSAFKIDSTDILAFISVCFPELEPICTYFRHVRDSLKYILNLPCASVVYKTCENIIKSRKKLDHHPQDLLQTILDAEADDEYESATDMKKLPEEYVIANALLFMAAGYDTTSSTLSWCICHLSRYPEIQERIRQEIKNNVKDEMEIEYSDLSKLTLLDNVISETLRFWPFSIIAVNRICKIDYHYKGMTIPKGCAVAVPVGILQSDPEQWKQPNKFDPDRFSSITRAEMNSSYYQPFGDGPRICIGERLAKTVMRLVLANLLRSYKLEFQGDEKMEMKYGLLIYRPKSGVLVKAIKLTS